MCDAQSRQCVRLLRVRQSRRRDGFRSLNWPHDARPSTLILPVCHPNPTPWPISRSSCILLATTSTYAWVTPANIATSMVSTRPGSVASRVALHAPPLQRQVHAARRAARGQLRMSGDLSVVVQSVTSAPLSSNNCVKDICSTALGFVTCKVTGGDKLVLNTQPLASSFFAVGTAQGSDVIVPCGSDARKGQTLSVASNLAVPVPAGWSKDQAGLFPALCILFLQGLQGAGIGSLSQLSGKTVLVTGGLGPAASLALQLCAAAGARVVATGSESERSRLEEMGAGVVIDYRKDSFWDKLQADGVQLFLVIDGLGAGGGTELSALEKAKVKYVSAMHPAVALVVREGLWTGVVLRAPATPISFVMGWVTAKLSWFLARRTCWVKN